MAAAQGIDTVVIAGYMTRYVLCDTTARQSGPSGFSPWSFERCNGDIALKEYRSREVSAEELQRAICAAGILSEVISTDAWCRRSAQ